MYKIIVTSHGKLAEGIVESLSYFMPNHKVEYISLDQNGIEDFKNRAAELLAAQQEEVPLLVFTDLFNGSPFNVFAQLLPKSGLTYDIVAGVSLPVLMEAALQQEFAAIENVLQTLKNVRTTVIYSEELLQLSESNEDE
ncbi:PTS sugar transporter subunit IIA [Neobacillus sp. 19]|uniref:PTS sugar transporter subunit IIA n=1 Tax=Neobacillus sp. 19 TaxID=3394458 RepID=UPI003BF71FE1